MKRSLSPFMFRTYSTAFHRHSLNLHFTRLNIPIPTSDSGYQNFNKAHLKSDTHKTDEPTNISRTKVHLSTREQASQEQIRDHRTKGAHIYIFKSHNNPLLMLLTSLFISFMGNDLHHHHPHCSHSWVCSTY